MLFGKNHNQQLLTYEENYKQEIPLEKIPVYESSSGSIEKESLEGNEQLADIHQKNYIPRNTTPYKICKTFEDLTAFRDSLEFYDSKPAK